MFTVLILSGVHDSRYMIVSLVTTTGFPVRFSLSYPLQEWLDSMVNGQYRFNYVYNQFSSSLNLKFDFSDANDAMLFKLVWA